MLKIVKSEIVLRTPDRRQEAAGRGLATRACSQAHFLAPQKVYNQNNSLVQSNIIWNEKSNS